MLSVITLCVIEYHIEGGGAMYAQEVLLFGDSIARGIMLDTKGSYKPFPDCFAVRTADALGYRLINKARFGCTISKGLEIIRRSILRSGMTSKNAEPKRLAFLELGGNDCDFRWDEVAARPTAEHLPNTPPETFRALYSESINILRQNGYTPVLLTLPPLNAERYFAWFTRTGLDRAAILVWLGDVQFIYRWHESYSNSIWQIGEKEHCTVLDIRSAFLKQRAYENLLCIDGIHPNHAGHELIKHEIMEYAKNHDAACLG